MQQRFGIKDLVVIVLLLVISASIWIGMFQRDREWKNLLAIQSKLGQLENDVARLTGKVAEIKIPAPVVMHASPTAPSAEHSSTPPKGDGNPSAASVEWARPGVAVTMAKPYEPGRDPRLQAGFAEGGEFTEIFEAQMPKVVPYLSTDNYSRRAIDLVCDTFADFDPNTLELKGVLAEAWQFDPQGLWLRIKIRDDAVFSDGTPVTAEDVRWTFQDYVMNQTLETERYRSTLRDQINRCVVISPKVVEWEFKEALFSNLESGLTQWILPKHFYSQFSGEQLNQATGLLMGSGPFMVEGLDPDRQWAPPAPLKLVRNPRYWGLRPPLDAIRYLAINDELGRVTAFRNGEAEMVTPSAPQFRALTRTAGWDREAQSLNWINMRSGNSFIAWNCGERGSTGKLTPFHDKKVRQAMTYLLNREKMVQDIWDGVGMVSKGVANPSSPASPPDMEPYPYDVAKGKALLREAGWEDRDGNGILEDPQGNEFVFEFTYSSGGEISQRIAVFVQDAYARAGIKVTLHPIDWSIGDSIRNARDFDAFTMAWGANAPESDPRQIWHSESIKNGGDNFIQWNCPEADKQIDAGRRELDYEKRMKIWHQFEYVVADEQPYTWIRVQPYLRFISPKIGNVNPFRKGPEIREFFRLSGGPSTPMSGG